MILYLLTGGHLQGLLQLMQQTIFINIPRQRTSGTQATLGLFS